MSPERRRTPAQSRRATRIGLTLASHVELQTESALLLARARLKGNDRNSRLLRENAIDALTKLRPDGAVLLNRRGQVSL